MQQMLGQDPGADDTKRLLVTIALCAVVYLGWMALFGPRALPEGEQPTTTTTGPVENKPSETAPPTDAPPADAVASTDDAAAETVRSFVVPVADAPGQTVKTIMGGFTAGLSTHGGQLVRFTVDGYGDHAARKPDAKEGEPLPPTDLVKAKTDDGARFFGLRSRKGDVALSPRATYEIVDEGPRGVTFSRLTKEGVRVSRDYRFVDGRFGLDHTVTVANESTTPKAIDLEWVFIGQAAQRESSLFAPTVDPLVAHCTTTAERFTFDPSDLEDGPITQEGAPLLTAGIGWQYFLAALLPAEGAPVSSCTTSFAPAKDEGSPDHLTLTVAIEPFTLAPGESKTVATHAYLGPKQLQLLEAEGRALDENIDFGFFGILSRPILWTLVKIYGATGNFGIAIILLTLLIKLLTFPLTQKSYVSMQQMKTVAPDMKKLQEKYGHDRALLGQKQMELYKEKQINPMAGCFPVLIQMPVWFALYRTLWSSVELYQQPFYSWIIDLSRPDVIPGVGIAILPFVVGALMFAQTALQPPPQDQPQMKYVLWSMPIMFTFFMLGMPSGLSLYMITNSVLTMAQQLYIKKKFAG